MQELVAPQVCEKAKKDWLPIEEEGIMPRFLEDYEITRSTDDFVTIASVKKWLDGTKSGVSLQKLKAEIAKHCDVNSIDKILTDNIKKGNCKVWKKVKCVAAGGDQPRRRRVWIYTLDHKDQDGFSQTPRKKFEILKISSMNFSY